MPIIRLKNDKNETVNKAWRALIETKEPVHRIPPANERRYVISRSQLARLRQLKLDFDLIEE